MTYQNYFVRDNSEYRRQIQPVEDYIEQASEFLSIKTGKDKEACREKIALLIKQNPTGLINNPTVKYLERNTYGDRFSYQIQLSQYIRDTVKHGDILAPTFTTYVNPEVKQSILGTFIRGNVEIRSKSKKEALAAQAINDIERFIAKNNEQGRMKIYNNSLSGAFGSNGTSLVNLTGHSTLTSTTRSISSLGNAINEKMIAGNRHYRNFATVINNIVYIVTKTNYQELQLAMDEYRLHYPTAEEALSCVEYSTKLYWINQFYLLKILDVLEKLTPIQLAAFVYIGDLYHIRKHNPEFVRTFLTELKEKAVGSGDDLVSRIYKVDENVLNFACQVCSEDVKGLGKKYAEMPAEVQYKLIGTSEHIEKVQYKYRNLVRALFITPIIPASVAYIPSMVRRAVVLSDTDSTMFSTDNYVQWYYGRMIFSPESFALASSVMFITTQSIANGLKVLAANIGVAEEDLGLLTMKPEFSFPVFVQTPVAKHYFASISVQEGNVFSKPKYEIKGVHLKSSAAPPAITKMSKEWMETILDDIQENKKISLKELLTKLADLERVILDSINSGQVTYFRTAKIKQLEAYAGTINITPYFYQLLWEEVFQQKYGVVEPIPNTAIKIPLALPNKSMCALWIESIEDKELAARLKVSLQKYNKDTIKTILINKNFCISQGIPKEIIPIIDKKKIVLELTKSFRMIIESLGYCIKKDFLATELEF